MNYSQTWLAGGRFADDHRHSLILSDNSYQGSGLSYQCQSLPSRQLGMK